MTGSPETVRVARAIEVEGVVQGVGYRPFVFRLALDLGLDGVVRNVAGRVGDVPISSMPSVAVDLRLGQYAVEVQSDPLYRIHRFDARRGLVSEIRVARRPSAAPLESAR